ncbi:hypothetical protein TNCV_4986951 [Trichonephila clavipes]|nr:hypothetical protein TNCV_4986951 [Trichonephila clavipes]
MGFGTCMRQCMNASIQSYGVTTPASSTVSADHPSNNINSTSMELRTIKWDSAPPDGHGYELVSSVRALVPQKLSVEEELMHVKHVEVKSPHVGVMWKFGRGVISSGIVLVT